MDEFTVRVGYSVPVSIIAFCQDLLSILWFRFLTHYPSDHPPSGVVRPVDPARGSCDQGTQHGLYPGHIVVPHQHLWISRLHRYHPDWPASGALLKQENDRNTMTTFSVHLRHHTFHAFTLQIKFHPTSTVIFPPTVDYTHGHEVYGQYRLPSTLYVGADCD